MPHRYFVLNKPFNMVSQFVSSHAVGLLGDLDFDFPEGTHAIGRLDNHSEGLLLLTTNKKITRLLFLSDVPHERTYLVQVNNIVSGENIQRLRNGVPLRVKNGAVHLAAAKVEVVDDPAAFCVLEDRLTAYPPNTWLRMTITEGKFHQVRKMIGAIRHKCKRLVRISIEDLQIGNLPPGCIKEMEEADFFEKLKLERI